MQYSDSIHTNCWVIRLQDETGKGGYYLGLSDGVLVSKQMNGQVLRFQTCPEAEKAIRWLAKHHGINIEEATPEEFVHEKTAALWLGDGEWPDGISVELSKEGKQFLLVRDDGQEFSTDDLDGECADAIVRLLHKMHSKKKF